MIKRRSVQTTLDRRSSSSSIAYGGDGDDCGMSTVPLSTRATSYSSSAPPPSRSFSFSSRKLRGRFSAPAWSGTLVHGLMVVSCITAIVLAGGTWRSYRNMQYEEQQQRIQYKEEVAARDDAKRVNDKIRIHLSELLHARRLMEHESNTAMALSAAGEDTPQFTKHEVVSNWLERRQGKLEEKIASLKKLISEESRDHAIEKFGVGPHRVEFTVSFYESDRTGTFVVEMASLNLMPHAVNTFLRQVDLKLWDKTVFWHHDGIDHIISASPVLFDQAGTKNHHFEAMGVRELGFAEYSPDYPHEELTLGFSDRGPNFYINILNNTIVHGPGGQGGSRAKDHADPCFGKIIDGLDTVREMYKLQLRQSSEAAKRHEWHDDEVTKIVSVTILK